MTFCFVIGLGYKLLGANNITYFNATMDPFARRNDEGSSFKSASGLTSDRAAIASLIGASLLSSKEIRQSPLDPWGNVKIPLLHEVSSHSKVENSPLVSVGLPEMQDWVSLTGITVDLGFRKEESSFEIDTSYLEVSCQDRIMVVADGTDDPKNLTAAGFKLSVNNATVSWVTSGPSGGHEWNTAFLDTIKPNSWNPTLLSENLIYGSIVSGESHLELYNCTVTHPRIEARIYCLRGQCRASDLRRSAKPDVSPLFRSTLFSSMLGLIPSLVGAPDSGFTSPLDQFMLCADNAYAVGDHPP